MKHVLLSTLLLTLASCASMMTGHRMKAADRKLGDTRSLQVEGRWDDAIAMAEKMHSSVSKSVDDQPVRKSASGAEVDLRPLLAAWENGPLKELDGALKAHDAKRAGLAFVAVHQQCANCHLALGKTDIKVTPLPNP